MRNVWHEVEPASSGVGHDAIEIQQHQLHSILLTGVIADDRLPRLRLGDRMRQQQYRIRLSQTQSAPGCGLGIGNIHHKIMAAFDAMKPLTGMLGAANLLDQSGAPKALQAADQLGGKGDAIHFRTLRGHGKGLQGGARYDVASAGSFPASAQLDG